MCSKQAGLGAAVAALCVTAAGCVLSDYRGWPERKTAAEAKLWGSDIAFDGFTPAILNGTYTYTVQYNCRGSFTSCPVTITSYRNPVVGAFSRDGIVDRDGDNIQGHSGSLTAAPATPAGKFQPAFVVYDNADGCQFWGFPGFPPMKQNFLGVDPLEALCFFGAQEEVDADQDLQQAFASLGDLLSQIWAGTVGRSFTLQVTAVELNGNTVDLSATPFTIGAMQNGLRPINYAMDFSSPAGKALIRGILTNTVSGQPVTVGLDFAGGMHITLPASMAIAFNHDALQKQL